MLGLKQAELAEMAGISKTGLINIESGQADPKVSTLEAIRRALEAAGVEFTNGGQPGVRMRAAQEGTPDVPPDFAPAGVQTYVPTQPRRNTKVPR